MSENYRLGIDITCDRDADEPTLLVGFRENSVGDINAEVSVLIPLPPAAQQDLRCHLESTGLPLGEVFLQARRGPGPTEEQVDEWRVFAAAAVDWSSAIAEKIIQEWLIPTLTGTHTQRSVDH